MASCRARARRSNGSGSCRAPSCAPRIMGPAARRCCASTSGAGRSSTNGPGIAGASRAARAASSSPSKGAMRLKPEGARARAARCARAARVLPCVCLVACVSSSHQLIGTVRAPVPADEVQLYTETPLRPYERIALVSASSKRSMSFTFEGKAEVVVRRLKEEAGKLGANGVLLEGISDESGAVDRRGCRDRIRGPARYDRCRRRRLDPHAATLWTRHRDLLTRTLTRAAAVRGGALAGAPAGRAECGAGKSRAAATIHSRNLATFGRSR